MCHLLPICNVGISPLLIFEGLEGGLMNSLPQSWCRFNNSSVQCLVALVVNLSCFFSLKKITQPKKEEVLLNENDAVIPCPPSLSCSCF